MVVPDTVTFPCQVNVKVVVSSTKLDVPVTLPLESIFMECVAEPTAPLVPVIEPVTLPFASIVSVRSPPTS